VAGLPPDDARTLLWIAWGAAIVGVAISLAWVKPPRLLLVGACIAMGWAALPFLPTLFESLSGTAATLLLTGGIVYSLGAVVYAKAWPNPWPRTYGYHEVYHTLVLCGVGCHFIAMWSLLPGTS
jgi:hemolysin III